MGRIIEYCSTVGQAEAIQDLLYDKYQTVSLIGWPMFSPTGEGLYVWAVDGKIR